MKLRIRVGACVVAASLVGLALSAAATAQDKPQSCRKGFQWARGTGCVSDAVVRQAKHNCKFGPAKSDDWPQCICNDGGKIAACGD